MLIRLETPADVAAIGPLVTAAMRTLPQASGTEAAIVSALRKAGALTLSLVAVDGGTVLGHLAASPARIGEAEGWALIGPLAVLPDRHRQGIGSALMRDALLRLRTAHRGAALVGDPDYYRRFGFRNFPGVEVSGIPARYVQALPFDGAAPQGEIIHHPAFTEARPGMG